MKFMITGKKVEVRPGLKEKIETKISKMDRYFQGEATAQIVLSSEKDRMIMEATISSNGTLYRAQSMTDDWFACLDEVVDLIVRQIRKNKTRLQKRLKEDAFALPIFDEPEESIEEENIFDVVKTKKFSVKPMDVEEAILQMNLLGHTFFVYRDMETDEICVVYKRNDGAYGLIEPQ